MNSYRTRRATVDDLPQLMALWKAVDLPASELEKRFTEFQVAEDDVGRLVAAIGFEIDTAHGKIHSETFVDFALTDSVRPLLWERLRVVAQNHGLFRVWTEEEAPFWKKDAGFVEASNELMGKAPEFLGAPRRAWLTLQLREEGADPAVLDREFAMFKEAENAQREKLYARARTLNFLATLLAILLFLFVILVTIRLFWHSGHRFHF